MRLKTNFLNLSSVGEVTWDDIKEVLKTKTFWLGIFGTIGVLIGLFILMHFLILPWYTMQGRSMEVPNVVNMPKERAMAVLEDAGFIVETREQFHNPAFPVGVVGEQRPVAQSHVKPGRHIILFVNSESRRFVEVPNVTMLLDQQAEMRLKEMGLQIGQVRQDSTSQLSKGTVIRQDPQPRVSVKTGTPITLWVSINYKTPPIPDLSGRSLTEAQTLLRKYQLRISVAYNDGKTTSITSQSPGPGSRLRINDVVRVFLGNPPVEEPDPNETPANPRDTQEEEEIRPPADIPPIPPPTTPKRDDGVKRDGR
ncbi:MAG TPA: PASTA domain-containing protein [Rhodothermales bacterium]|nr:PASTA domain-containing protein [Rhodothermales bacterium]HRR09796.1 PASTA domain-containing protein [Rhodothermales bacterium]